MFVASALIFLEAFESNCELEYPAPGQRGEYIASRNETKSHLSSVYYSLVLSRFAVL